VIINLLQVLPAFKNDVRCLFNLYNAPVILQLEVADNRAVRLGKRIKLIMDPLCLKVITELLCLCKRVAFDDGIIQQVVVDTLLIE
jgi:hypothetical protein